jgi:hypothetical protein
MRWHGFLRFTELGGTSKNSKKQDRHQVQKLSLWHITGGYTLYCQICGDSIASFGLRETVLKTQSGENVTGVHLLKWHFSNHRAVLMLNCSYWTNYMTNNHSEPIDRAIRPPFCPSSQSILVKQAPVSPWMDFLFGAVGRVGFTTLQVSPISTFLMLDLLRSFRVRVIDMSKKSFDRKESGIRNYFVDQVN